MGVTIHYRGSFKDLDGVEDFEDRVLDLVLDLGGHARIWRSSDSGDSDRVVRGLIVDLAPGQESTSLLISPEGWLICPWDIEAAERGELTEPSWCSVKTQYGPIEGHVALVELLAAIKRQFMPDLEVNDEGEYWETRNLAKLQEKVSFLKRAIDTMADALSRDGLSAEAAEDPEILATRIERIARQVQRNLSRPVEHLPVEFPDNELGLPIDWKENETRWDQLYKENRRKQERIERNLEERMLKGEDMIEALEGALREEVAADLPSDTSPENQLSESGEFWAEADEPWQESLLESDELASENDFFDKRHPLQEQATNLLFTLHEAVKGVNQTAEGGYLDVAMQGLAEIGGGLAQALPVRLPGSDGDDDAASLGLSAVQLKRALRGAAFAHGALIGARQDKLIAEDVFQELIDGIKELQTSVLGELKSIRSRYDRFD